jgi:hypothetical protein
MVSASINDVQKNCLRCALLNTGGDSKISSSTVLRILILAMARAHKIGNSGWHDLG